MFRCDDGLSSLVKFVSRAVSLVSIIIQYSELNTLTIIPCIGSHCPSLEHLDIAVPNAVDMASRQSLMALCGCEKLSTLRLRFTDCYTESHARLVDILPALIRSLKNLRTFTARNLPTYQITPWSALSSETLRELDLSNSKDLGSALSPGARIVLPALETLNIAWNGSGRNGQDAADHLVAAFAAGCPALLRLLVHSSFISRASLDALAAGCRRLEVLRLGGLRGFAADWGGGLALDFPELRVLVARRCLVTASLWIASVARGCARQCSAGSSSAARRCEGRGGQEAGSGMGMGWVGWRSEFWRQAWEGRRG